MKNFTVPGDGTTIDRGLRFSWVILPDPISEASKGAWDTLYRRACKGGLSVGEKYFIQRVTELRKVYLTKDDYNLAMKHLNPSSYMEIVPPYLQQQYDEEEQEEEERRTKDAYWKRTEEEHHAENTDDILRKVCGDNDITEQDNNT